MSRIVRLRELEREIRRRPQSLKDIAKQNSNAYWLNKRGK